MTGSSARLLSRELATSLRGRTLTTEVLPFSFNESLVHRRGTPPEAWPPDARRRSELRHHLDAYLRNGGFPEVQLLDPRTRLRVLQSYVDVVLLRDVVERHEVANLTALRSLVRRRGAECRYVRTATGFEVDFLAAEPGGEPVLVQVCADLDGTPETRPREIRACVEAARELSLAEATIVTLDETDEVRVDGVTLHVVPAWRWLAGG